jgi:hypothetical protein
MVGGIIFSVLVYVPMVILAVFLLRGKGAFLLAGYNTMSEEKRAKYNMPEICRFFGRVLIVFMALFLLSHVAILSGISWLYTVGIVLAIVILLGACIYANKSKRFRKSDANTDENTISESKVKSKATKLVAIAISVVAVVAVGIMFIYGEMEPVVDIHSNSIQIRAMYGLRVDFNEIADISLVENSMRAIGVGTRTNGYGGFGGTWKGHFQSMGHGAVLLFVRADAYPTIHIERSGASDIFISFRDGDTTKIVYSEMITAFNSR